MCMFTYVQCVYEVETLTFANRLQDEAILWKQTIHLEACLEIVCFAPVKGLILVHHHLFPSEFVQKEKHLLHVLTFHIPPHKKTVQDLPSHPGKHHTPHLD